MNESSNDEENYLNIFFKLDISSIQMFLYEEESTVTSRCHSRNLAFSQMELNGLNLLVNLYNDSKNIKDKMNATFKLETIILDDIRQIHSDKHIKLIEKYHLKRVAPKPMINVSFENKLTAEYQPEFINEKNSNQN